ncbi:MAG: hydrogenase accessory protein HypB [Gammaproteobacteria bacterium]|nr:MAG: hydrogenase accessory protein HypB [Gammaproteobacteria bacterium]
MCDTCGCNITPGNAELSQGKAAIPVLEGLLRENDRAAAHNRAHLDAEGVLAINLMSSPGAGKTALLEATCMRLGLRTAVIEGDLETENDARRLREKGIEAFQITTGNACHLDAHMVHRALHHIDLQGLDILFIENVGNLVCPASFDLGQHFNVTLLSVPEGDDKPAKYPVMFRAADLVLLSKADLLPILEEFSPRRAEAFLRQLANPAPFLPLSAKTGQGLEAWFAWIREALARHRRRMAPGTFVPVT